MKCANTFIFIDLVCSTHKAQYNIYMYMLFSNFSKLICCSVEIDCEVTESIGFTNVACNTSKELLFQPSCSLLELGADPQDAISFACKGNCDC